MGKFCHNISDGQPLPSLKGETKAKYKEKIVAWQRSLTHGIQYYAENFILAHIAAVIKFIEGFVHVFGAEI